MYERISLTLGRVFAVSLSDLRREEGQGATEYAMVIAFVVVGLTLTLGLLGGAIQEFLGDVAGQLEGLIAG
jgi:Flp pilus assembly pilin Flp